MGSAKKKVISGTGGANLTDRHEERKMKNGKGEKGRVKR